MPGIGKAIGKGLGALLGAARELYYWVDNLGNNLTDNFGNKIVFNSEV